MNATAKTQKALNRTVTTRTTARSRRQFLRTATSVIAAPYIVPASVFGQNAPSNRITVGCIGIGNQGAAILQRFLKQPDCQVVAVCDVNRGSGGYKDEDQFLGREPGQNMVEKHYAKQSNTGTFKGCAASGDFRELLDRDDIDAVTIVSPDHWHAIMSIMAAEKGKDIYCEKPLALTIGQGRAIADAVEKYNVVFQTGSHERSNPNVRLACELVLNGSIGEVKRVITHVGTNNKVGPGPGWQPMPVPDGFDYDMWLGPAPMAPYHQDRCLYRFRFNYDYAGGQVANFGAHSNDMAQWGLGMDDSGPIEVECLEREFLPAGSLFNTATRTKFRCLYENGVELICQTDSPSVQCLFEGTEGTVQVQNKGQNLVTTPDNLAAGKLSDKEIKLHHGEDHQRNFLDCVKSRQQPAAPVEVGHRSATVCHLGNIAVRLNTKLQWDPVSERCIGNEEANAMLYREMRDPWAIDCAAAAGTG